MNFVEPIRDRKKIAQIKNQLRGQQRYRDQEIAKFLHPGDAYSYAARLHDEVFMYAERLLHIRVDC